MTVVPFEPSHYDKMVFREYDLENDSMGCTNRDKFLNEVNGAEVYTVFKNDTIISITGSIEVYRGNFYVWQTPAHGFEKHLKTFVKGLRIAMNNLIENRKPHRLFTICEDHKRFEDWMTKGVGFNFECRFKGYGGKGIDMIQYMRLV